MVDYGLENTILMHTIHMEDSELQKQKLMNDNKCRCIDCGGDQPEHDSTCEYMLEMTVEQQKPEI